MLTWVSVWCWVEFQFQAELSFNTSQVSVWANDIKDKQIQAVRHNADKQIPHMLKEEADYAWSLVSLDITTI